MSIVRIINRQIEECNFLKIVEYMKSKRIPDIEGYEKCSIVSIHENDGKFIKIIRRRLPISTAGSIMLGSSYGNFKYEFISDENMIVSVAINPEIIEKYFRFKEIVTIRNIGNGLIEIERETETINLTTTMLIAKYFSGSVVNEYHESSLKYIIKMIEDCKD